MIVAANKNSCLKIFTSVETKHLIILLVGMIFMAIFEVLGIGLILPFMSMLLMPDKIFHYAVLSHLFNALHFSSTHAFLIFVGLCTFTVILLGNIFSALMLYKMLMFSTMLEASLAIRLLKKYLYAPYEFFIRKHASDLNKAVLTEVSNIMSLVLTPGLQLIARAITVVLILLFLIFLNPVLALIVSISVMGTYFVAYLCLKKRIRFFSQVLSESNVERHKIVKESFDAIKDVKFMGLEDSILEEFRKPAYNHAFGIAQGNIMSQVPRYVPETVAFGGILLYLVVMLALNADMKALIPVMTVYVYAGIRLLPAVQQSYTAFSLVKLGRSSLIELLPDLIQAKEVQENFIKSTSLDFPKDAVLKIEGLSYVYPGATKPTLNNLSLKINSGSIVAFAGRSGSGKTTIVDLILTLLKPQQGFLALNENKITEVNESAWKNYIGYVPQQVYLVNKTLAENIALGFSLADLDMTRVKEAAKLAEIHDYIETELLHAYLTQVGGEGIRLSGGQQQRIGIARALYRNPKLIVLDEATSALDNLTEQKIFNNLLNFRGEATILLITHRLATLDICDKIFVIDKDRGVVETGTFSELRANSVVFNQIFEAKET